MIFCAVGLLQDSFSMTLVLQELPNVNMFTVLKSVFSFVHLVIYELSLESITIAKCHSASAMSHVFFPQTFICLGSISIGILSLTISFSIEPLPFIGTTIWILESVSILSYA